MEEVKIPITIDDSGFGAGTTRIIGRMEDTQKEVNKTGMSIDKFAKHMQEVYRRMDRLTAAVEGNKAAMYKDSQAAKQLGRDLDDATAKGTVGFGRLEKAAVSFFGIQKAKEFVSAVYDVTAEIEKLKTTFHVLAGEQGDALFASIRRFAAGTSMLLKDLAGAAQDMMGFGIATEDIMENLEAIGNAAMGDSQRFRSLALAFSQASSTGKLMGQDFLQMVNAGFNPLEQMSKTTGKSISELKDDMSAGAISADMLRQAFIDASSAGGKFHGMLESQSKTLAGAASNLEGAISDTLNDIGQKNEEAFATAIDGATTLVKNYEKVAGIIQDLIVVYGTYKTALMVCNAVEKSSVSIKQAIAFQEGLLTVEAKKLAAARGISVAAARAELGSVNILTVAKMRLTAATKSLTAAMMANPYVLVAAAVSAMAFGIYKLATAEDAETAARRRANDEMQTFQDNLDEQKNKIQSYMQTLQDSNATEYQKAEAWEMLNRLAPTLTEKYDRATLSTMDLAQANKELTEEMENANYDHLVDKMLEYQKKIAEANKAISDSGNDPYVVKSMGDAIQTYKAELDLYAQKVAEVDVLRKKIAEDNKPLEIRIEEANGNAEAKAEIYDFYKRAADLAGELKTAHDAAAGTIANSGIPQDYDVIADGVRQKYDDLINELEKDVDELRGKIAESPASMELEKELKGKEQVLNDLLEMKRDWDWSGATTIPLNFQVNFSQVEKALHDAQSGNGRNTNGMKWVEDKVSLSGGHWEKDDTQAATHTASQWRKEAYNSWKKAQEAVDDFWANKESMDKATFEKEYKDLKAAADKAKKDYDSMKGDKKASQVAKDASNRRVQIAREEQRWQEELEAMQQRAADARTDANIASIKDDGERERAEQAEQHARTLRQIDKQGEEMKKAVYEHNKKLWEAQNKDKHYEIGSAEGRKGWQGVTLNADQMEELAARRKKAEAEYSRLVQQRYRDEAQAMWDYLQEYGTYEQQKLAITEEYAEKIRKAQSEGEKLTLQKERDKALQRKSDARVVSKMDWLATFSNLGTAFEDVVKNALAEVNAYMQTDEFKHRSAEDQRAIIEARKNLQEKTVNDATFAKLNKQLEMYRAKTTQLTTAEGLHKAALERLTQAETTRDSIADKNSAEYAEACKEVAMAQTAVESTAKNVAEASGAVADAQRGVSDTASKLQTNLDRFSHGLSQLSSGSLAGTLDGLDSLVKSLGGSDKAISDFKNLLKTGLSAAFGEQLGGLMAESLDAVQGVLTGDLGEQIISGVLSMVNEMLEGILKGGFITKPVNALLDGLRGIGNTLTFGGLNSWMSGSNAKEVAQTTERLTDANERLRVSIDGLKDEISGSVGANSIASAKEALNAQEKYIENQREILKTQQGYHGAHHSNAYYWNLDKAMQKEINDWLAEYARKNGTKASTVGSDWGSFSRLSAEEMDYIRKHDAELWSKLTDIGKYDKSEYFDAFADLAGSMKEITDSLNEALTGTTAENVFDDFLSSLYDLADGSEDVMDNIAENWQKMVNRMAVNNIVGAQFQTQLEAWYKDLAELNKKRTEGGMTDEEYKRQLDSLKSQYDGYVRNAQDQLEQLGNMGIIKPTGTEDSETNDYFSNLRESFLSTLTDMEGDAKNWSREITRMMVEDLINIQVLGDSFEKWMADWRGRYANAIADGDTGAIDKLREELAGKREELAGKAQDIMDDMGYSNVTEEAESAFSDLHSSFLETLTDMDADAEEWSKNITRTMVEQLIERNLLNEAFDNQLDGWRERFESVMTDTAISDAEREAQLRALREELEEMRESLSGEAQKFLDSLGYSDMMAEKEESPFKDLRQSFADTLTDMSSDAEDWRKTLNKTLTKSLIEKFVMGDGFDDYLEDWNERYVTTLNDATKSQDEIETALNAMIEELVAKREQMLEQAENLRDRLSESDTTFTDMRDNWLGALMDMRSGTEDFVNEVRELLTRKMVEKFVMNDDFNEWLEDFQKKYNAVMSSGMNEQEMAEAMARLAAEWETKTGEMSDMTQRIFDIAGWSDRLEQMNSPLSDLRSSFVNALTDMEGDAQDFGRNISQILTEAFVDKFVLGDAFEQRLSEWQEQYASIMGGNYSDEERARLLKSLQEAIAAAKEGYAEEARTIQDLMEPGSQQDQSATMSMAEAATYDQFETYLGIAVAQQMATIQGNDVRRQILSTLQTMNGITSPDGDTVKEIRMMLGTTNEYLLDLKRSNRAILSVFGEKLDTIISKLKILI